MKERFIQDFLDKARQYTNITAVTPEILHQFVRKIYAHEKQKIFSRMEGNLIETEYTFERPKATQRRGKVVYGMQYKTRRGSSPGFLKPDNSDKDNRQGVLT